MSFPEEYELNRQAPDLLSLVSWQLSFGPRYPGSDAHAAFRKALADFMKSCTDKTVLQDFSVILRGKECACTNVVGVFSAADGIAGSPENLSASKKSPLLIGSHFDTRPIADNDPDPALRDKPIPGANDGASGTAILLYLARALSGGIGMEPLKRYDRDIYLVLFNAEDIGNIDGNDFASGAEYFAANPVPGRPGEVIVLDMVGGKDMVFDVDSHIGGFPESLELTKRIFSLGRSFAPRAFSLKKSEPFKYIISDHAPFMVRGIPSCILIDIDYPEWHTHADLPQALSGVSLSSIFNLLLAYISRKV